MIVIFSNQGDLCATQTYEYLKQQGKKVVFIDMASDFLNTSGINWSLACSNTEGFLIVNSQKITLTEITSVLCRTIYPSYAVSQLNKKDQDYIRAEAYANFMGLLNSLNCLVINRPKPGFICTPQFANSLQIKEIKRCGLKLPNMVLTTSYENALNFYDSCNRIAILGSTSPPILLQMIKGEDGVSQLQATLNKQQPIYIQEVPVGKWFQAFVAGNSVLGSSFWFDSQAGIPFQAVELSLELQEQCCKLAQALQFKFMQIRILQTEQGESYCYDISEFPSYAQCEKLLQEKITIALAELLEKGEREAK